VIPCFRPGTVALCVLMIWMAPFVAMVAIAL
jgi:hypothetical protein